MRSAGYALGSALTFLLVYNIGAIVGTLLASTLAERIGAKYLVLIGFASAAIALALLGTHPSTALLMVLIALTGFGGLGTQNMLNDHVAGFYPADARRPAWAGRSVSADSAPSPAPPTEPSSSRPAPPSWSARCPSRLPP